MSEQKSCWGPMNAINPIATHARGKFVPDSVSLGSLTLDRGSKTFRICFQKDLLLIRDIRRRRA